MALFKVEDKNIKKIEIKQFTNEKELQSLLENNLEELFQVKFIETEFKFADEYSGRLDTIGIDYENNPVIIEYKYNKNDSVISQTLFYMDWLINHKGDFEIAAKRKLGNDTQISWNNPKMIIVAQDYNKYDKFAVNRLPYDVYLYRYKLYNNDNLYLENINVQENKKYSIESKVEVKNIDEKYIRKTYNLDYYLDSTTDLIKDLYKKLNEKIMELSDDIEIRMPKNYIAYRTTKNFAEVHFKKYGLLVYMIKKENYEDPKGKLEKVPESYQWSVGYRITISNMEELEYALNIIRQSYFGTL